MAYLAYSYNRDKECKQGRRSSHQTGNSILSMSLNLNLIRSRWVLLLRVVVIVALLVCFSFSSFQPNEKRRLLTVAGLTETLVQNSMHTTSPTTRSPSIIGTGTGTYFEQLRFVAFGTSRTHGAGLKNRNEQAFPFLLSKGAHNLAIRAAGPQYPALCTYSMLGDNQYDVILLEYNMKVNENLLRLGRRLRDRFPEATIVFLHLWMPFLYYHSPTKRNLKQILEQSNVSRGEYHPGHLHAIVNETDHADWIFDDFETGSVIESIAQEIGAVIYHMPRPDNSVQALLEYGPHFNYDMVHLSERGHASIAQGVAGLLRSMNVSKSNKINKWREIDACESWYQTGLTKNITHSSNTKIAKFGKKKFGLEVAAQSSWLRVNNPLPHPAAVFMSYMVTAPHQDYPAVSVALSQSSKTTEIIPVEKTNRYAIHVVQTVLLGTAPMGDSTILITPRETRKYPFRVTGILITSAANI